MVRFSTDNWKFSVFSNSVILYTERPKTQMYWMKTSTRHCQTVANAMTRKRFEEIMRRFHVCDNLQLFANGKSETIFKTLPINGV